MSDLVGEQRKSSVLQIIIEKLDAFCFGYRKAFLTWLMLFTVVMGYFAVQLKMDAGFEKQLPIGHEYIKTFRQYESELIGANRINIVVKSRKGTIWTAAGLRQVYDVTQAVAYLPYIDRVGVQSLWTPNTFVNEITEEGFRADPLISGTVTPNQLTQELIDGIRQTASQAGFIGTLVSHDQTSAMITADIAEVGADGKAIDYIAYNDILEKQLRAKFENADFEIQIIGFAKQIGDIADGASSVLEFCAVALLLTLAAVYWYCRSIRLTLLAVACSFTSLIWQFGALKLLGLGLDPLAVLVPFLVFSIGVSHGVQQINFILREISEGKSTYEASRASFSGLLIPGVLALVTAFVSFVTLALIPIPMVRELAATASLGIFFKITTNLAMLPIVASFFSFDKSYADALMEKRAKRSFVIHALTEIARPRVALVVLIIATGVFGMAAWESRHRIVGTLEAGAPELRPDARYNLDAVSIAASYDTGLDWLTVIFEAPPNSCDNVAIGAYQDRFDWQMQGIKGVLGAYSYSGMLRTYSQGYNEGNPKMNTVPIDPGNYAALSAEVGRIRGFMNRDCSMTAVNLFLTDHKAETINKVIAAVKDFRESNNLEGVTVRLASGNAGVMAAINEEVERSELPMVLYVYAAIFFLVAFVYRDLRAVAACCIPLAVGTFIGYWFMKELQIGLTVATLPVMVLAAGIGVDYAFYIYNRLQMHLADGKPIQIALNMALTEVGTATIFTAITLAIGMASWAFSSLKFQADMGKLLAFMFIVNMIMAMTVLPAIAIWLEKIFPRKTAAYVPSFFAH